MHGPACNAPAIGLKCPTPCMEQPTNMSDKIVHVTDNEFEGDVLGSEKPVLVDYWAEWCGPCKMIAPVLEQLSGEREMTIAKVNTDINPLSAGKFGIRGIPALLLFHNGQLIDQQAGAMPKPMFDQWLDRHMA